MKRRNFLTGITALFAASCARPQKRAARYDEKECPFCKNNKGTCSYCGGDKKCSYCGGSGKRKTVIPPLSDGNFNQTSYVEECPYCKGGGSCHFCEGNGECWACGGDGIVESWEFMKKRNKKQS